MTDLPLGLCLILAALATAFVSYREQQREKRAKLLAERIAEAYELTPWDIAIVQDLVDGTREKEER